MNHLEEQLCSIYKRKYGVYTGNGTTAMYLAFEALGLQDRKVVFPQYPAPIRSMRLCLQDMRWISAMSEWKILQ